MVITNLDQELIEEIKLDGIERPVLVSYPWLPDRCSSCHTWGHKAADCKRKTIDQPTDQPITTHSNSSTVPDTTFTTNASQAGAGPVVVPITQELVTAHSMELFPSQDCPLTNVSLHEPALELAKHTTETLPASSLSAQPAISPIPNTVVVHSSQLTDQGAATQHSTEWSTITRTDHASSLSPTKLASAQKTVQATFSPSSRFSVLADADIVEDEKEEGQITDTDMRIPKEAEAASRYSTQTKQKQHEQPAPNRKP